MYVIRVIAVTDGKERNRTIERVWAGCFRIHCCKIAQGGKCVNRRNCIMGQFGVRF